MLRMLIALLLIACSAISGAAVKEPGRTSSQSPRDEMDVIVKFGGLLVFASSLSGGFDVGVLSANIASDHHLQILGINGNRLKIPTPAENEVWSLAITGSATGVAVARRGGDLTDPTVDTQLNQHDTTWIIDLQKLHKDTTLRPVAGRLNPIIRLKDGVLYSLFKTDFMQSAQGRTVTDYGFFTETVALRVRLHEGQDLVLSQEKTNGDIYRVHFDPSPGPPFEIAIKNIRDPNDIHHDESDFKYYYRVFENGGVPAAQQYDFQIKEGDPRRPRNPAPRGPVPITVAKKGKSKARPRTCCGLDCNPISLSGASLR